MNGLEHLRAYYGARYKRPFRVSDRGGKHYGTHVLDSDGNEVVEFWTAEGEPSSRELARFNGTRAEWEEYRNDGLSSHWECEADYQAALAFVELFG